jgi:hypothetical protein
MPRAVRFGDCRTRKREPLSVMPRFKRGIQSSVPLKGVHNSRRGVLDRPVEPGDDM